MNKKVFVIGTLCVLAVASGIAYGLTSGGLLPRGSSVVVSSVMLPRSVAELSSGSYAAIVGTVTDVKVAKEKSSVRPGESDIVTTATINVEKYLANPHRLDLLAVRVKTIGGTIGGDSMVADGYPEFKRGTKVVVFLNKTEEGEFTVYGTAQGKFTVNEDGTLGTEREKSFIATVFNKDAITLTELESQVAAAIK